MAAVSDMAMECRWGRRKQKNPRRKNVDEEVGVDQVAQQPNSPASPAGCHDDKTVLQNGYHSNETDLKDSDDIQSNGGLTSSLETMQSSDADNAENSFHDTRDHSNQDHDSTLESVQSSDLSTSLETNSQTSQHTKSNENKPDSSASLNGSESASNHINGDLHDSGCQDDQPSSPSNQPQSEEDKIQELMGRSDTVVIFPEPVSDHEDSPSNPVTEDPIADGEYLLKCPHCHKGFTRVYLLKEHITTQHADKASKHMCPECGVSFALKSHLDKHLCLHSPTAQVCKICNKTFANVYRLSRHMISHEESTELRKFKCPECGKAFKFKHHLKEHIRIHSGEKPFECSNCGKRFSHSGSYSSHMTSKKCWVMNLKMKGREKVVPEQNPGLLRPLVPKGEENGVADVNIAHLFPGGGLPPQGLLPFDPQIHAQFLNGARPPFIPHIPFSTGHMINPMMPGALAGIPYPIQSMLDDKSVLQKMQSAAQQVPPPASKPTESAATPSCSPGKVDENQNNKSSGDKQPASPQKEQDTAKSEPESKPTEQDHKMDCDGEAAASEGQNMETEDQNTEESKLTAVQKVLDAVNATVSQQQKSMDDKSALSKLIKQEAGGRSPAVSAANQEADSPGKPANQQSDSSCSLNALAAAAEQLEKLETKMEGVDNDKEVKGEGEESSGQLQCRFCKVSFSSAIDLHQHERYLCEENKEIRRMTIQESPAQASSGKSSTSKEEEDTPSQTSTEGDIRKCRARSLISEDQHQILRAYFQTNPRPGKTELEMLAKKTSLPKRVVQVWFQNQRARYRRKGQLMPIGRPLGNTEVNAVSSTTSSPYIPVVPQISPSLHFSAQKSPGPAPPQPLTAQAMQVEPLDLSTATRVQPQEAHVNKPFSKASLPPKVTEGEVLNLSTKSDMSARQSPEVGADARQFEDSAIYKYMQREGMIPDDCSSDGGCAKSNSPSVSPMPQGSLGRPPAFTATTVAASLPYEHLLTSTPHLRASPGMMLPTSPISQVVNSPPSSRPSSLDTSFNSSSMDMDSLMGAGHHDNGAIVVNGKPKRARKKSWRQMESEEFQMEYENALEGEEEDEDVDEDHPSFAKKRRSWKQHKVETGEGMYACDQCDKMFSKQSSLARHKYEHSGQRPFPCDICSKAFKHKHHLTEHKRLHSGEKPFTCKKCGKRFSHSGSYSQHMNHRYKYCKPLRMGEEAEEDAMLQNQSEAVC